MVDEGIVAVERIPSGEGWKSAVPVDKCEMLVGRGNREGLLLVEERVVGNEWVELGL